MNGNISDGTCIHIVYTVHIVSYTEYLIIIMHTQCAHYIILINIIIS